MPLPTDPNQPWPPRHWQPIHEDIVEAAAWYAGDETELAAFYGLRTQGKATRRPSERVTGTGAILDRVRFWARRYDDQDTARQRLHIPAAADIAATSADLLFGEEIRLTVAAGGDLPDSDIAATVDRLDELAALDGWATTLLEAGEVAAGLGGVCLRATWDVEVADHPMLTVVHADHAVPEFRWDRLVAVTFWRELERDGTGAVWRHLERHERGRDRGAVLHGLYVGRDDKLGSSVPLDRHPETAGLEPVVTLPEGVALDVAWMPNVLPNRRHRHIPVGRADTAGTYGMLDALDETWSSWMRDIRLGKARIIVPDEFLDRRGRGRGASFDLDREIWSPLNIDPGSREQAGITLSQFEIRYAEHARTAVELLERIVSTAGYSPATFALIGDTAQIQTATEVAARQARTKQTISRKRRYAAGAISTMARAVLAIDREIFGRRSTQVVQPTVVWPSLETDARRTAETVEMLRRAQAASTETLVRLAQPDLDGEALAQEIARVQAEHGLVVGDPTGGLA